jgi:hypothetical protein
MSRNIELFEQFVTLHTPDFFLRDDDTTIFCLGTSCMTCVFSVRGGNCTPIPKLTPEELECVKKVYPEYFI